MKIYKLIDARRGGDEFTSWFFSLEQARENASDAIAHMTKGEREKSSITITGYEIGVESYAGTAEQMLNDLFNGDLEAPEWDEMIGFVDGAIIHEEEVYNI